MNNINFLSLLENKVRIFNEGNNARSNKFNLSDAENFGECMSLYSHCNKLFDAVGLESIMEAMFESLENFLFPFDFDSEDMSDEEKEAKFKEVSYFSAHNKFFHVKLIITQLFKIHQSVNRINWLSDRDKPTGDVLS